MAAAERAIVAAELIEAKERAEEGKAKAAAKVAELEVQLTAAEAELQPKRDALAAAREAAAATETARVEAAEAARKAARGLEPVSVFISRRNLTPLCPAGLSAHTGHTDCNPRSRSSDWYPCFHRPGEQP